jgi:hypothetical protein
VTVTHFLRKTGLVGSHRHLAVIVFPDETSVFQAYRLLHYYGISPEHLAIVGQGYSTPERVGLLRPMQIAFHKAVRFSLLSGTVGTLVGLALALSSLHFNAFNPVNLSPLLLVPVLGFVSGFCGAVLGGLFGLFGDGNAASIYRHHLNRGRYLLMMEGPEKLVRWGQDVLTLYPTSPDR